MLLLYIFHICVAHNMKRSSRTSVLARRDILSNQKDSRRDYRKSLQRTRRSKTITVPKTRWWRMRERRSRKVVSIPCIKVIENVRGVSIHLLIQRPIALERCIFMPMDMDTSTRGIVMQQVTTGCSKHAFHSMW